MKLLQHKSNNGRGAMCGSASTITKMFWRSVTCARCLELGPKPNPRSDVEEIVRQQLRDAWRREEESNARMVLCDRVIDMIDMASPATLVFSEIYREKLKAAIAAVRCHDSRQERSIAVKCELKLTDSGKELLDRLGRGNVII